MATQIQLRRDTAANWTSNNPTLASGEFGWESDTNRFKIGTGSAAWTALGYASEGDTAGITFVGDDSTGTTVSQNETFKIAGTQNITAVVSGDTLTLTGPDLSSYLTAVAESDVTQHQSALSITESQISDLQSYKTVVSESDVTQHQAALSITESQISDLAHFSGAYADLTGKPTIPTNNTELANGAGYITGYTVTESDVTAQQAALSITESQISDLGTYLTAETNDLSSAVTWANVPDANITQGSVTQHQGALSITESQISDLGAYITGVAFADVTAKPTTVAGYGITDAASTAQGDLADSALQSGDNISELVNDSAFITASALTGLASETYVGTQISNLVDTAPETLNTLNELAAALGDDANFATTTATALGNKANTADLAAVATSGSYTDLSNKPTIPADVSNLTDTTNLLDHFSGAYADLTGKPTIPTNNTELSNGAGYITGYTVSEADVTGHQGALSITESQISDLGAYITGVAFADVSAKPTTISGYGITDAFSGSYTDLTSKPTIPADVSDLTDSTNLLVHFSGSYTDLTSKPTIPTNNNELSNGAGYITELSGDTTPQLGGNLDLNTFTIDGTGNISITGDISTDAISIADNVITTTRSNDILKLQASGTGDIYIGNVEQGTLNFSSAFASNSGPQMAYITDTASTILNSTNVYPNSRTAEIVLNADVTTGNRARITDAVDLDLNGNSWSSSSFGAGPAHGKFTTIINSQATTEALGTAQALTFGLVFPTGQNAGSTINVTNAFGSRIINQFTTGSNDTVAVTNLYGHYYQPTFSFNNDGTATVANEYAFYVANPGASGSPAITPTTRYGIYILNDSVINRLGGINLQSNTIKAFSNNTDLKLEERGTGRIDLAVSTQATAGSVAGYINVKVNGTEYAMPYYNKT